ncbi:sensor histidine kinase [Sphingomonas sp. 10B4]|uniref:sensor histidine kinase n=1 Tax=Sphingomonas sp. 10B4 TaxID=3048575 RepID=UPI002AB46854|nr:histidine kinase dimerization/phosphoacceptor domain -containing protein [Sphingomonas sp. 10B4]MDY7524940.1 histidine kinase dimerization/phosphoacceptor domain -containing protein [Sphingomonas sp. 10B4]MEB0282114.1 histidine kinase dimerization/phosphoacceptor domain -containing protein [Sphingomonas sp. 10B4]
MTDDRAPQATNQTALLDGPSDDVVETTDCASNEPTSFAEAIEQVGAGSLLGYRLQQQAILSDFGLFALQCRDNEALLAKAAEMAADGMQTSLCKVLEYRAEQHDLIFRAGVGWRAGVIGKVSLAADDKSPAGFAYQNGTPVISNHLEGEERFRTPKIMVEHGVRRAINVLISTTAGPWGVLEVDSPSAGQFEAADIAFLQGFANLLGVAMDRQEGERRLAEAIDYQKVLVREASHRVKNSLTMLSSILHLQSRSNPLPEVSSALNEASGHVIAIARTHDQLWRQDTGRIEIPALIKDLCASLSTQLASVTLECSADDISLHADQAVAVGLLLTELVTNAAKYAYGDAGGRVVVTAKAQDSAIVVTVRDFGKGLPEAFDMTSRSSTSLGMQLIRTLVRSLDGVIEAGSDGGAWFAITFPAKPAHG